MTPIQSVPILRPGPSEAFDLLGKWVVCRIDYGGPEGLYDTDPAQVVGVVVPAPGTAVKAQLLMNSWDDSLAEEGFQYEVYLDYVQFLVVVSPPQGSAINIGAMYV